MLSFAGLGQAIEAAPELDDSAAFTKSIEGVRMDPLRDEIAGAQRAALVAERLNGGVKIPALHGG